jgi:hypothetical protein
MAGAEPEVAEPEVADAVDPDKGSAALELISERIAAYEVKQLVPRRGANAHLAGVRLVQTGKRIRTPEIRASFERLDNKDFDIVYIDLVEPSARAVIHLVAKVELLEVNATSVKLPIELVNESTTLRERLFKLLNYYFEDHPVIGPQLVFIKGGIGYIDLSKDLSQLATLAKNNYDVIKDDKKHFRPTDTDDAFRLSSRIDEELELQTHAELKAAQTQLMRSWTLLNEAWDEVCAAGTFLYRKNPKLKELFSYSAYALGRRYEGGSSSPTEPTPIEPPE